MADAMAARSACTNRQVGAVIVDPDNRPISVGYNGPPAGFPKASSDCSGFCPRSGSSDRTASYSNCVSVHAEANALVFADRQQYKHGTIFITNAVCWDCAKLIANSGLSRVVMRVSGKDLHADIDTPKQFLADCGIEVITVRGEE